MKKTTILILAIFLIGSWLIADEIIFTTPGGSFSLQINESSRVKDGNTDSGTIIDNIALKLEELEINYLTKLGRMDQTRAKKIVEEIFALLVLLPTDSNIKIEQVTTPTSTTTTSTGVNINLGISDPTSIQEPTPIPTPVERVPQETKTPMSESDFERLINNVREESFSDDQLRVIRLSARNSFFSVNQIVRMINVLTFSDDQLEALRIMYDKVTDPENGHSIINAFTYSSDKAEAERIISK
ncbi:MAG: DUF4476 domain-containing protein [Candidatus Cloacimonetes bacterium]|nr:DUF4476 domain-containing protein [Candidatus Cloacimonadota bacterium]